MECLIGRPLCVPETSWNLHSTCLVLLGSGMAMEADMASPEGFCFLQSANTLCSSIEHVVLNRQLLILALLLLLPTPLLDLHLGLGLRE